MDCDKFEPLLLDELYEELDELTSAAVKRHVSGCARCGSILNGLRATRRGVALGLVPVPAGLEDRILAAAKEAQKVVPIRSKMSRAIAIAGSWAMRPQTAMAAVFLLMIGTSAFVIRSKNYAARESAVSVTVEGSPSPVAAPGAPESLDDKAAAAAHGPSVPNVTRPPAQAAASAVAANDDNAGPMDRLTGGVARGDRAKDEGALALGSALSESAGDGRRELAPAPAPTTAPGGGAIANAAAPAGAPYDDGSQMAQSPAKNGLKHYAPADPAAQDPFSLGAAAFRARNFAEAAKNFDRAAQSGDTNAELWAAESTREGQGCAVALGRVDQLAQKAAGSWVGSEASLRAARCQARMGQLDQARDRLNHLAQVPSHQQQARAELAELNQVAARKAGGGAAAGAAAAPKRAVPAARAPARAPAAEAEQKKATDVTTGY
jgi:hypothetical protein